MHLTIEIPEDVVAALTAQAQAQGLTAAGYVSGILKRTVKPEDETGDSDTPFETGYGMWAKYGRVPSIEEIDENRREMFRNFGDDF